MSKKKESQLLEVLLWKAEWNHVSSTQNQVRRWQAELPRDVNAVKYCALDLFVNDSSYGFPLGLIFLNSAVIH